MLGQILSGIVGGCVGGAAGVGLTISYIAKIAKIAAIAGGAVPGAGWIVVGAAAGIAIGAIVGVLIYNAFNKTNEKQDDLSNAMNQMENGTPTPTIEELPSVEDLKGMAGYSSDVSLSPEAAKAKTDATKGLPAQEQPLTAEQVAAQTQDAQKRAMQDAKDKFNETIASWNPNLVDSQNDMDENKIKNPLENKDQETKEKTEKQNTKAKDNIDRLKKELTFEAKDFKDIKGYVARFDAMKSTVYVKTRIELISEDDEYYQGIGIDSSTKKYVRNGNEYAVSVAYDADGNPLDRVILITQEAYLEVDNKGQKGFAKITGQGTKQDYAIEGYGLYTPIKGGSQEYSVFFESRFNLTKDEEKDNYDLGDVESTKVMAVEDYVFRDKASLDTLELTSQAIPDVFEANLKWACEIMRELSIESFDIDLDEKAEYAFKTSDLPNIGTLEENGITYKYNKDATITNTKTGSTFKVQDLLDSKKETMKSLIDKYSVEPISINDKKFESKEDLKDAETATKPSFEIKVDEPEGTENFQKEVFYTDENGARYYFTTKRSHRYHIVTKDKTYSLTEALEIYTIDELIKAGLDCKKSLI